MTGRNKIAIVIVFLAQIVFAQEQDSITYSYKKIATYDNLKLNSEDPESVVKLVLKGKKYTQVPKEIFKFTKLEYLDLSGNKIDSIPKEIGQLKNLKVLILEGNKLEALPEEIYQLKNLQVLRLGRNSIYYMSSKIDHLENLVILDLWDNNVAEFPEEISELKYLRILDLRSVSMNDEQQYQLIKLLPNAKVLMDVSCNCN